MTDDIRKAFEAEFPCLALRKLEEGSYADPETARYFKMFQAGAAWKAAQPVQTDFDDRINRLRGKSIWLRDQRSEAQELIDDMQRAIMAARTSEGLLDPDMPAQEMRLHCGEMTAQEIRTARAVIRWANSRRAQPVQVDDLEIFDKICAALESTDPSPDSQANAVLAIILPYLRQQQPQSVSVGKDE